MRRRGGVSALTGTSITMLGALVLATAAATGAIGLGLRHHSDQPDQIFTITNTISDSSSTQEPALLYPGANRYLWYTAHNTLDVPITVTSMRISNVEPPANCPLVDLDYSQTTFSGSLLVPPHGTNAVAVPISLIDTNTNQDSCAGTTFNFSFSGTAQAIAATSTKLTTSPNPSTLGSDVTLTAFVSAGPTGRRSAHSAPSGIIDFYVGDPTGVHDLLGSGPLSRHARATLTLSSLALGATHLYATYAGDSTNGPSTSPPVKQEVLATPVGCNNHQGDIVIRSSTYSQYSTANDGHGTDANHGDHGHDCVNTGDGDHVITGGDGNDLVNAGDGSDFVNLGNGNDVVQLGNGSHSTVIVGNGDDSVTLGHGSYNHVILGHGSDVVSVTGSHDVIVTGKPARAHNHSTLPSGDAIGETVNLGAGMYNTYVGAPGVNNVCHLPAPPPFWTGSAATYFHDTILNCTVVTP